MPRNRQGLIEIIFDLIKINYDRAECFETVLVESSILPEELIELFNLEANNSRRNALELTNLLKQLEGFFSASMLVPGSIFNVWSSIQNVITATNIKVLLSEFEKWNELTLEAYRDALAKEFMDDYETTKLLMDQKFDLHVTLDKTRKYLDMLALLLVDRYNPAINMESKFINVKAG